MKKLVVLMLLVTAIAVMAACGTGGGGTPTTPTTPATPATQPAGQAAQQDGGDAEVVGGRHLTISYRPLTPEWAEYHRVFYQVPLQEAFPNDTIEFILIPDRQTLHIQVAAGAGPNVMLLDGATDAIEFASSGRILALDGWAEQYGWADIFYDWAYATNYWQGRLYGLPINFEGMGIYYNLDVLEMLGHNVPQTHEELLALIHACVEAGIMPFAFGNANAQGVVDWLYSMFLTAYAGPEALREAVQGTRSWNDPLIRGSIEMMVEWWQNGWITNGASQAITITDARTMFAEGQAAMTMEGSWLGGHMVRTFTDTNWTVEPMPGLRPGVRNNVALATGGSYVINASAPDPDFAAEVLNWMFTTVDRHQGSVVEASFQPYPIRAIDAGFFYGMDPGLAHMYDMLMSAMEENRVGWCAWTFFAAPVRAFMNENTDALFLGIMTIDDFLAEVQTISDAAVAAGDIPPFPQ